MKNVCSTQALEIQTLKIETFKLSKGYSVCMYVCMYTNKHNNKIEKPHLGFCFTNSFYLWSVKQEVSIILCDMFVSMYITDYSWILKLCT
jgi:hypothetical protein